MGNVTDLRVQLYKKSQKMQQQKPEPEMKVEQKLDDYEDFIEDDDRDSLEKAQLSSSEEEYTHRNIQITSTNRIVKKPSKSSPKRLIKQEQPLKKSAIRPTLMSRLGGKVPESDESEEEEELAPSPPPSFLKKSKSKSSDENEKKEKKKKEKK